jgi:hypothetical protein
MHQKSDNNIGAIILITSILIMIGIGKLLTILGADRQTTGYAVLCSMPILMATGAAIWRQLYTPASILLGLSALWPVWWRVLDSIAADGQNPDTAYMFTQPFWDTAWVKWPIEIGLISLAVWVLVKSIDRY